METVLLLAYFIIFVLQILLFVFSILRKSRKLWLRLFLLELIPMVTAAGLAHYYNGLPLEHWMSGFTYLGEVLFSVYASWLYGGMLALSGLIYIVGKKKWC